MEIHNTAAPNIEEGLVRDEQTNEVYLPLTSTVGLKRTQEKLYVPLDLEKKLTVDAPVDSGALSVQSPKMTWTQ